MEVTLLRKATFNFIHHRYQLALIRDCDNTSTSTITFFIKWTSILIFLKRITGRIILSILSEYWIRRVKEPLFLQQTDIFCCYWANSEIYIWFPKKVEVRISHKLVELQYVTANSTDVFLSEKYRSNS